MAFNSVQITIAGTVIKFTLPQVSMALAGRIMRLTSQKLRMTAAMTMEPI